MRVNDTLLTIGEVAERTRLSKPTIYKLVKRGDFPRQLHLCANKVAWLEGEVAEWIAARAGARAAG
jgi:prophage regulatory protein